LAAVFLAAGFLRAVVLVDFLAATRLVRATDLRAVERALGAALLVLFFVFEALLATFLVFRTVFAIDVFPREEAKAPLDE
jgi:hypothetical protein